MAAVPQITDIVPKPYADALFAALKAQNAPDKYPLYEQYRTGTQPLRFATAKFAEIFGNQFKALADNYCRVVVNILAGALKLETVSAPGSDALQPAIDAWLESNRIDAEQTPLWRDVFLYGNGYIMCAPDPEDASKLQLFRQDPFTIRVLYDPDKGGKLAAAIKCWQRLDGSFRLILFAPDGFSQWDTVKPASLPQTATLPDTLNAFTFTRQDPYPVPGVIPLFHFTNEAGRDGQGQSELISLIPMQDGLNKTICDMMVGMEYNALPQRYAIGLEIAFDPETNLPKPMFDTGTDRLWYTGNPEVKFGQFDASDLSHFLDVAEGFRKECARLSRIPLHYLTETDNFPSGEALKTANQPFVDRMEAHQSPFGNVFEDMVGYFLQFSGKPVPKLSSVWTPVSARSEKEEAEAAKLAAEAAQVQHTLGVASRETLAERLGFDWAVEAPRLEKEAAEEQQVEERLIAKMASGQAKALTGGNGGASGNRG